MPLEIVTTDGRTYRYREYTLPSPGPHEVRVRVEFAAPKHGTESKDISGRGFAKKKHWDSDLRMLVEDPEGSAPPAQERGIGNIVVGAVLAVGDSVTRFHPGERVFGYGSIREEHQASESSLRPIESLTDEDAVCTDPAHVAFVAVRDGKVRIGDHAAVFGLGAIGLMAVQIARAGGARKILAIDPIAIRRDFARKHGADEALDPRDCDAAIEIKRLTDGNGVDVAIETSGNGRALQDAIRCIRQCGTVVHVPWGPDDMSSVHLDEEWHLNRPTLIGSQAVWNNPDRDHPLWNEKRARAAAIELFQSGLVTGQGLVTPIVPFREAADALAAIFTAPETTIKVGVRL